MISQTVDGRITNSDPAVIDETAPIAPPRGGGASSMFRSFGSLFGANSSSNGTLASPPQNAAGYVEFGMQDPDRSGRTLGTFAGVFSPVALSMFSALVFIRVGFIVGNAGLYVTLLQFVIAYCILLFTVASVCAISTNGAIEGGGVYFMISRTLGVEFGGSIGTLFFLANVVGCAMAISGCTEGIMENFGPGGYFSKGGEGFLHDGFWWRFLFCTLINTCMLIVCLIGAALFAKTSVLILGIVTVCLVSTYISFLAVGPKKIPVPEDNHHFDKITDVLNYTGLNSVTLAENMGSHYGPDYTSGDKLVDFATTFGVLFAGVTGIMAGANMSGELKNPAKSIPTGTLSAVAFTFVSYIILSFLMAWTTPYITMQNNYLFLMPVNFWPPFTAIGILTATFSTGLSNLIGSSRILEALSKDQVFGPLLNFIVRGTWKGNPVAAVVTSWVLVECILLIGSLNTIAQINSVLFMLSYLATNLACLGIELTGAPNFRPLFKYFSWHTCLCGLLGTLIMMFVINPIYASSSIILCLILVIALHLFSPATQAAQWGSISQALMFHQVRKYLLMLDSRKDHVKFWRPQMLLLVSSPRSCCPLVDFVNDMKKGGLYVIGHVQTGDCTTDPSMDETNQWLAFLDHMKVKAFAEVTIAPTIREGVQHLIRLSGIGAMKPNTIILGFYDSEAPKDFFQAGTSPYKTEGFNAGNIQKFPIRNDGEEKQINVEEYVAVLCDVLRMKKNLCVCRHFQRLDKKFIAKSKHMKYIDVWPINTFNPKLEDPFDVVSLFMMQLAVIINMLAKWKHLRVRIFLCETSGNETNMSTFETQMPQMDIFSKVKLEQSLKQLRIVADIIEIQDWSRDTEFTRDARQLKQFTKYADPESGPINQESFYRSLHYMQRANQIIRERSDQTAVSFIYLAAPPNIDLPDFAVRSARYMELLTELTADLPPTILVHGNKNWNFSSLVSCLNTTVTLFEAFEKNLAAEIESRKAVSANVKKAQKFYDSDFGEVKIVEEAHKIFRNRIKNVKEKLDEIMPTLPSPIPLPEPDADLQLPDDQSLISFVSPHGHKNLQGPFRSFFLPLNLWKLFIKNVNDYTSYLDGKLPFDINDFTSEKSDNNSSSQPIKEIRSRIDDASFNSSLNYYKPEPTIGSGGYGDRSSGVIPGLESMPVPPVQSEYSSLDNYKPAPTLGTWGYGYNSSGVIPGLNPMLGDIPAQAGYASLARSAIFNYYKSHYTNIASDYVSLAGSYSSGNNNSSYMNASPSTASSVNFFRTSLPLTA